VIKVNNIEEAIKDINVPAVIEFSPA